ncbi:MAG: hypothetical protein Q4C04_04850 [Clostridia bacterium]|nr:hypothetical protein [Clostridia bacterium]
MYPLRQLFRRPAKTLLGTVLIMLASALLCVSVGQYVAALRTQESLERDFATVALTTSVYKTSDVYDEDGEVMGTSYSSAQPPKVQAFLDSLNENSRGIVKSVYHQGLISGYCPSISPINYVGTGLGIGGGNASLFSLVSELSPYNCALLEVELQSIGEAGYYIEPIEGFDSFDPSAYGLLCELKGTIKNVLGLHEGYHDPTGRTVYIDLRVSDLAELETLNLQVGERYLVYSMQYEDMDWDLRRGLVSLLFADVQSVYDFDLSNIRMLSEEEIADLREQQYFFSEDEGPEHMDIALLEVENGSGVYLSQSDLDAINASRITVVTNPLVSAGQVGAQEVWLAVGSASAEEYVERFAQASIVKLEGSAADFLNSTEDELWQRAKHSIEVNNHAFPIITTQNLRAVAAFAIEDALISEGRSFTMQEYEKGSKVCVISETLAAANGVSIGDKISLRFYGKDDNIDSFAVVRTSNPSAFTYSTDLGFASVAEDYEIVGLYRQKNEWSETEYSFTPNTIFVPEQAVTCATLSPEEGIFKSIALENGMQAEMDALLEENGLSGLFVYYDQGYAEMQESLNSYFSVSTKVIIIGVAAWIALMLLYILLFPLQQRKELRRMWSLGVPNGKIRSFMMCSGAGIYLFGVILGGILGLFLLNTVIGTIGEAAGIAVSISGSIEIFLALCGIQLLCLTIALIITTACMTQGLKKFFGRAR